MEEKKLHPWTRYIGMNFQESAVKNVINRGWLVVIQNEADWRSRVIRASRSSARFNERARILIPSMESNYELSLFPGSFRVNAVRWLEPIAWYYIQAEREWNLNGGEKKEWRGMRENRYEVIKEPDCNKTSEVQDEVRRRIVIRVTRYFPCPFCFCPIRRGLLWKSNIFGKNVLILDKRIIQK